MITLYWKPESTNHIYKFNRKFWNMYMTAEWKKIKKDYALQAKFQTNKKISWDVVMKISFYFPDKRKRDIDNYNKIILDSFSWVVYDDDKQIQKLILEKFYDKENPRIIIEVNKFEK